MRWHIELILEIILFVTLLFRNSNLRWFDVLVGVDMSAQVLQIIPYRAQYHAFSALFWRCGVILVACATLAALIEACEAPRGRVRWWHIRILALWTSGASACAWLMVGQPDPVVFRMNTVLLVLQAVCFVGWTALFLGE